MPVSQQNSRVLERLYASAQSAGDLPWHQSEPPTLLVKAMDQRERSGNALDLGCGAGTYSLYMANRGYDVTAIDFLSRAVEMARQSAASAGCTIDVVQADVTSWSCDKLFDVILDVGCLHSLTSESMHAYKQNLLRWLAPGGDYILTHCGKRGWWDRWPVGPHRISRANIEALFAPELSVEEYAGEQLRNMPLIMGRTALIGRYWFRKN